MEKSRPLFLVLAAAACGDGPQAILATDMSALGAAAAAPRASSATVAPLQLQDIGVPGGVTIEPLARSDFPDAISADLRIKLDGRSSASTPPPAKPCST